MTSMSDSTARAPEGQSGRTIRVYGRPIASAHETSDSAQDVQFDAEAVIGILYCGFRAGNNDVRIPTGRIFYLRRADIGETGPMADYVSLGEQVHYYDVPIAAEVRESTSRPVSLGAEMVHATGGTFASLAATPPQPGVDTSAIEGKSRQEMKELARDFVGNDVVMLAACAGYCQTNTTTSIGIFTKSDQWGADCD